MNPSEKTSRILSNHDLYQLKRWNTPTIYNGWEQVTQQDPGADAFNIEETHDFMPQMGPMVGYAVTLVIEPGNARHRSDNPGAAAEYHQYLAAVPGPKIVVVQDLDKPRVMGSHWGEVNANLHRSLGCVGTITDGAIRDVDEMTNAGFKALAQRLCVGHAYVHPVRWNCEVEVFGRRVNPGDFIHADQHGFMAIAPEDQAGLLDAARFMDENECRTVIPATRQAADKNSAELLADLKKSISEFRGNVRNKFKGSGEW